MRILFVEPRIPTPNRDGGSYRKWNLLRILLGLGADVSFFAEFPYAWPPFDQTASSDRHALLDLGVRVLDEPLHAHLENDVNLYDAIIFVTVGVAAKYLPWAKKMRPNATIIFDTVDLHYVRAYREAKIAHNLPMLQSALQTKRIELAMATAADQVWVVSDTEKKTLEQDVPLASVIVVPNVHLVSEATPAFNQREGIFFLGSFTFAPNVHAVKAFVRDIFPSLLQNMPALRFYIVGADPTKDIQRLANSHVYVTGHIPDLTSFLNQRRVCVAPLHFGAGIKGKILLSMGLGIPVITSDVGAEGIPGKHGKHWLLANTTQEWVAKTRSAYQDAETWNALSDQGRKLVHAHYSEKSIQEVLRNTFDLQKGRHSHA